MMSFQLKQIPEGNVAAYLYQTSLGYACSGKVCVDAPIYTRFGFPLLRCIWPDRFQFKQPLTIKSLCKCTVLALTRHYASFSVQPWGTYKNWEFKDYVL